MLDVARLPLFVIASVSLLLIPGPAVLYVITRSIHQGRRAGIVSVMGLHVGTLFHVTAAALGLSAILVSSALAFSVVKLLGAGYLVYIGIRTLRTRESAATTQTISAIRLRRIFSQGVVVNVLNPKLALFFFAFLPQFADPSRGAVGLQMVLFGLMFIGLGMITDSSYAMLAGTFGRWLRNSQVFARFQRYVAGTIFIGLGLTLALSASNSEG